MLTRLRIDGFKNLVDVDIRFGPFTCIAGPNAVGKSNLFDAIRFLSALANKTLMEAALSVRSEKASDSDVKSLFHRAGDTVADTMRFEVEMIAPKEALDDLGQPGRAKANFLRYTLEIRYREANAEQTGRGPLEIVREELEHIRAKQVPQQLAFPHHIGKWRQSALAIEHRSAAFISTQGEGDERAIYLHQDGGSRGRPISNPITQPRTVLSVANAAESPTVLCARREMESWRMLQLEPSALRKPDGVNSPDRLGSDGSHLPKTLYSLSHGRGRLGLAIQDEASVYTEVANRLAQLVSDVARIEVDYDKTRELLTLVATGKDGTTFPARSLSDGTLRFLALAVLELDPSAQGILCLEEPENGIHPERIPAMLNLLQDIAVDTSDVVDADNPLRQVIVNTHSPSVVLEVPDDSLLVVESRDEIRSGHRFRRAVFSHLVDTWRSKADPEKRTVPKGKLLAYLNPLTPEGDEWDGFYARVGRKLVSTGSPMRPRVADRIDLQMPLPHVAE